MIFSVLEIIYLIVIGLGILISIKRLDFTETKFKLGNELSITPLVSIIIPARNEAHNIANCLDSLSSLDYPNFEIILVDGNSSDETVAIASKYKDVKIVKEPPLPNNWVGKPWACHVGSYEARGKVLLFTDADTVHRKDSLNKAISELEKSKGFVTMVTTQIFATFWEHLLTIVFLMISVTVNGTKGNSKAQIANGQYMLFTRSTYDRIGGHESVFNSIVEDLALGTTAAKEGYKPAIIIEHNLVKARMYRDLPDIFNGFTKNLGLGMKQVGVFGVFIATIINLWAMGFLFVLGVDYLILGELNLTHFVISTIGYSSFLILLYIGETKISEKGTPYVLIYPLYFIMFWLIVTKSMIQTFIFKNITWKDRVYTLPTK